MASRIPLWLDCDPGHDDAFAILLAAYHPCLELLGISTVHGNASVKKTTANALAVLEAIGRPEVPVFPGASKPFCREAHAATDIHGESGLDGTDLLPKPRRSALAGCNAILEMHDALSRCPPNTAWIVATGTMSNVALLLSSFPALVDHIAGLSIMGGAVGGGFTSAALGPDFVDINGSARPRIGNITPYAEFNIWCDPEAAQSLFSNKALQSKTTLIPLDVTHEAFAGQQAQQLLLYGQPDCQEPPSTMRRMFNELLMFFAHTYAAVFGLTEGPPLHDPIAVIALLTQHHDVESRVEFQGCDERWDVSVELAGEQIGRTVAHPSKDGMVIPRAFDLDRFWRILNECMIEADRVLERQI